MSNHIHLICEAASREALARGLQGLLIRIARGLNRVLDRRGKVFADRYHDRVLKTPAQVRNAIAYVLNNARRHAAQRGRKLHPMWTDPFSSAPVFFGVREEPSLASARTWLLSRGWSRAGRVFMDEVPGGQ